MKKDASDLMLQHQTPALRPSGNLKNVWKAAVCESCSTQWAALALAIKHKCVSPAAAAFKCLWLSVFLVYLMQADAGKACCRGKSSES